MSKKVVFMGTPFFAVKISNPFNWSYPRLLDKGTLYPNLFSLGLPLPIISSPTTWDKIFRAVAPTPIGDGDLPGSPVLIALGFSPLKWASKYPPPTTFDKKFPTVESPNISPNLSLRPRPTGSGISPLLLKEDTPALATDANKLTPPLKVLVFFWGFNNCSAPCLSKKLLPWEELYKNLFAY